MHSGNCLYKAIPATIDQPHWYTSYHLRMDVVSFLVKYCQMAMIPLKPMLQARGISYYTLCRRTLISGEWGGLKVLIFKRFGWKLTTTVINPSHNERIHHLQGVLDSSFLLAYNGVTHNMAIGTYLNYIQCLVLQK